MSCSDATCIFEKAIPASILHVFMKVQSESDPKACCTGRFGPIIGLIVIEAGTSLYAVLEEVDKDPKEVTAA